MAKSDIESGGGSELYPEIKESSELRWAFIRKVYIILSLQMILTVVFFVCAIPDFITNTNQGLDVEQVRVEVNSWASHHTNGLIKDLLPPQSVKTDTDLIYGNALYFKGAWRDKFPKSCTRDKDFHLLNGTSFSVPFMRSFKNQFIMAYDGFKVLKLPFRQGDDINRSFSMNFYLPDEKDGLDNLVEKMTSTSGFLDSHIPRYSVEVGEFRIPKFKIEFGFLASSVFNRLGLDQAALYHKACVKIDEGGVEAVVVTVTVRFGCSTIVKGIDFVVDHPFIFLIREDQTGTVVFVGQIFDPSKFS